MVPDGWKSTTLGQIAQVTSGGTPSKSEPSYWAGGSIPWIRTTEIQNCRLKPNDAIKFITEEGLKNSSAKLLPEGTILLAMIGQGKTRGQIALLLFKATTNQNSAAIILKDGSDPEFYYNFLLSRYKYIRSASNSAGQSNLSGTIVKTIRVPAPPFAEQKKIAQILSTWDQAITATERLLENSQQRKKGLMQKLLTGKKRLPGFEGEWFQHPLAEVAKVIVSPVDKKSNPGEQPVHLCNYIDVYYNTRINKRMSFMEATAKDSEIEKYTLNLGDVVITKDSETPGDIAVPALVAEDLDGVVCGYHLAILRPKPSKLKGSFLNYLLSMPKTRYYFFSLATGATRFGLSVGAIHNAELTLPPVPEQEAIAELLTVSDDEFEVISQRLDRLKQEKRALMQQLLTGKRRVNVNKEAA
ncbi:Type I restriction modification DNA specificity domain protein [Halomonas sp. A3H3]|uniref:restriction endonuclease subunit S n=1 Tax=Halomonas sp. A3H3 TaxID=1346287 RepID=UPI00038CEF76|nr:restriction endonuclease subunit S [Halomonas sp. A3H3]CDG52293.1 Type I restriction modification DNA specificity domain protein [Halomonas sp. A3H3]